VIEVIFPRIPNTANELAYISSDENLNSLSNGR
jgi:hypothetical protein